jgi:hypothetical protein
MSVPSVLPAPPLVSIMMGWPSLVDSSAPTVRAAMSVNDPAPNGTTIRIGLVGHAEAAALEARAEFASPAGAVV